MKKLFIAFFSFAAISVNAQIETKIQNRIIQAPPQDNSNCCNYLLSSTQKGQVLVSNGQGMAPVWGSLPAPAPYPAGTKSFSATGPFYCSGLPADKNQKQWVPFTNGTITVYAQTTANLLISSSIVGASNRNSFAGLAVGDVGVEITLKVDNTLYEYNVDNFSLGLTKLVTAGMSSGAASIANFSVQVPPGNHSISLYARNDGYHEVIKSLAAVYFTVVAVPAF